MGLATGGLSGQHQHRPPRQQRGGGGLDGAQHTDIRDPADHAGRTGHSRRARPARSARVDDQGVLAVAHEYAHGIGKLSLDQYGSAQQAFGLCRETFQSGCSTACWRPTSSATHDCGRPRSRHSAIVASPPGAANALRFQCLHGLGHGLTANAEHDIFRALRLCDALDGDWDRGSCYSGVFMENIIFATHQVEAAAGGLDARSWRRPQGLPRRQRSALSLQRGRRALQARVLRDADLGDAVVQRTQLPAGND